MADSSAEPSGVARALQLHQVFEELMATWQGCTQGLEKLARGCATVLGAQAGSVWMPTDSDREPPQAPARQAWQTGGVATAASAPGAALDVALAVVGSRGPVAVIVLSGTDVSERDSLVVSTLGSIGRTLGTFLDRRGEQVEGPLLSPRETEVLQLAADGLTGPEIAEQLDLSSLTVKSHFAHIYRKLDTQDRAGAVARALRRGAIR